jgi:hypothetical protein
VGAIVVATVVVLAAFWFRDPLFAPRDAGPATTKTEAPSQPAQASVTGGGDEQQAPSPLEQQWESSMGAPPEWPANLDRPGCEEVEREMRHLCAALDDRPRLRVAGEGSPCEFLQNVVRDLAARPPDPSAELRSRDATLQNVFHLFRVLGAERMALLSALLAEEGELAEPAALVLYRWWVSRETCGGEASVGSAALYDYAGFAFNSIGGQAYLRRRNPRVEAIACFYALHALDVAIAGGHNPYGLDLSPEIERCAALVTTQPLVFSDRYREVLDEMARRWEAKGRPQ